MGGARRHFELDQQMKPYEAPFAVTLTGLGWTQVDVTETDKDVRITAELPGLD